MAIGGSPIFLALTSRTFSRQGEGSGNENGQRQETKQICLTIGAKLFQLSVFDVKIIRATCSR